LILILILFFYVMAVLFVSGSDFVGDIVQGRDDVADSSLKGGESSLIYEKEFYNLMNKEIDFNGKKSIERAILSLSDNGLDSAENRERLGELISSELISFCLSEDDGVLLGIPQGIITENGFKSYDDFDDDIFVESERDLERGMPVISHKIYYNDELIEIKFRMSKRC